MKRPSLRFGILTVELLRIGDSIPCPRKGHPPFTHERQDPAIVLHRAGEILRVIPRSALKSADPAVFKESRGKNPWALSPPQITKVKRWAARFIVKVNRQPAVPIVKANRQSTAPIVKKGPPRPVDVPREGFFARRAKSHPMAARALLECDYEDKLDPAARAWLEQFDRETALNRWYDGEDAEPFYARGSEERRKLQFEYNRRVDDLMNHKEWFPVGVEESVRIASLKGSRQRQEPGMRTYGDILPADAPTEDALIAAIDRSRE